MFKKSKLIYTPRIGFVEFLIKLLPFELVKDLLKDRYPGDNERSPIGYFSYRVIKIKYTNYSLSNFTHKAIHSSFTVETKSFCYRFYILFK